MDGGAPERTVDRECGCKMFVAEDATGYVTRYEWCAEHEKMTSVLRRILDDFELILADLAKQEGRVEI